MNILGIVETCLYADDLDAAKSFYRDVLGLELIHGDSVRDLFFRCGDSVLIVFNPSLTQQPTSKAPTHGATGPGHCALHVAQNQLGAWRDRLAQHNIDIETEVPWPNGTRSIYFRDPAGNSIELTSPSLWFSDISS